MNHRLFIKTKSKQNNLYIPHFKKLNVHHTEIYNNQHISFSITAGRFIKMVNPSNILMPKMNPSPSGCDLPTRHAMKNSKIC